MLSVEQDIALVTMFSLSTYSHSSNLCLLWLRATTLSALTVAMALNRA
ncbi:hypothetical protein DFQ01_102326 [Paenibacillus cellulosilyticus]|uniref:Uncharacterized protein n=1 Tax=Paenibacillus cellulosilyticus TaxID=375489 RepID=A0A2V2YZZ6_9BACL|nr:hypothetical protein DFQ01_102326 [Paenibacillus cellulosilyticus]